MQHANMNIEGKHGRIGKGKFQFNITECVWRSMCIESLKVAGFGISERVFFHQTLMFQCFHANYQTCIYIYIFIYLFICTCIQLYTPPIFILISLYTALTLSVQEGVLGISTKENDISMVNHNDLTAGMIGVVFVQQSYRNGATGHNSDPKKRSLGRDVD